MTDGLISIWTHLPPSDGQMVTSWRKSRGLSQAVGREGARHWQVRQRHSAKLPQIPDRAFPRPRRTDSQITGETMNANCDKLGTSDGVP
jgi:hypothetical protein